MLLTAGSAFGHQTPAGCFGNGVRVSINSFRKVCSNDAAKKCTADGDCGAGNTCQLVGLVGPVSECELIFYQATLAHSGVAGDCAFSGGTFKITLPGGSESIVSSDVPCLGGNTTDPNPPFTVCDAANTQLQSNLIAFQVTPAVVTATGTIEAHALYVGGVGHDFTTDSTGVGGDVPKTNTVVLCTDNDLCTINACDPNVVGSAGCTVTPVTCNDNNLCTTEACNSATGQCTTSNTTVCNDNNQCTTEACNTSTGACQTSNTVTCNDNNQCTSEACNTSTGTCQTSTTTTCDDNNLCTTESCNTSTGQCTTSNTVTCDDNNECTTEACNTASGQCATSNTVMCDDNNVCTDDVCNTQTGQCVSTPNNNPECQEAICRTPGFWKVHGSVSQQVINAAGGCLEICGEVITTATADSVGSANSVLEAMCIPVRGESRLQLVRQLTAMALNCVISGFGPDCSGNTGLGDLFADCTQACLTNTGVGECIGAIDCFNNGGAIDPISGLCGENPAGNCHEQALPDTIDQGPADTPQECNAASKNTCEVILANEANCTSGVKQQAPESCP